MNLEQLRRQTKELAPQVTITINGHSWTTVGGWAELAWSVVRETDWQ